MNKVSSIKSLKTDSPKTPGGISKSLLTPCRRLGLSRNYKKAGPVPFISPISGNSSPKVEVQVVKKEPRKRKKGVECEENQDETETTSLTPTNEEGTPDADKTELSEPAGSKNDELTSTPTRHFSVPCNKKSKTLLSALGTSHGDKTTLVEKQPGNETLESIPKVCTDKTKEEKVLPLKKCKSKKSSPRTTSKENVKVDLNDDTYNSDNKQETTTEADVNVTPLQKARIKSTRKIIISQRSPSNESKGNLKSHTNVKENKEHQENAKEKTTYSIKPRSPNDLTKECIVVIQKKIFKTHMNKDNDRNFTQQDSDSDVPLCELNKDKNSKCNKVQSSEKDSEQQEKPASNVSEIIILDEEQEDFIETKKKKVKNLEDKATSIGGLKKKTKIEKPKPISKPLPNVTDFDDEDDFDFDNKKTILIRKTYEKVSKPQKARSTGSITQRDIDELKTRIETKKKLLLARAMSEDTEELRSLIKKWQKGCQDALMELMELMKTKFPDKQNMDYSEMLSMLKIPTDLVGYDEENDCFNTPDDANIVLSKYNDL